MNVRLLACVFLASVLALGQGSANRNKALTQAEVLELLRGGVSSPRVTTLVNENGVDFTATEDDLNQLRAAGAQDALLEAIRQWGPERREALQHVKAGDQAQAAGYLAKAASEYTQAWQLAPTLEEIGLKAARLWSDRGDQSQAVRILRNLTAGAHEPVLSQAKALLDTLQPSLSAAFDQRMNEGLNALTQRDNTTALRAFQDAASLLPNRAEPHLGMARVYALGNNYDAATAAILAAVRQGNLALNDLLRVREFEPFLAEQRFLGFLNDVYGPSAVAAAEDARRRVDERKAREARRPELEKRIAELTREAESNEKEAQSAAQKAQEAEAKAQYGSPTASTFGGVFGQMISKSKYESDAKKWRGKESEYKQKAGTARQEVARLTAEYSALSSSNPNPPASAPSGRQPPAATANTPLKEPELFKFVYYIDGTSLVPLERVTATSSIEATRSYTYITTAEVAGDRCSFKVRELSPQFAVRMPMGWSPEYAELVHFEVTGGKRVVKLTGYDPLHHPEALHFSFARLGGESYKLILGQVLLPGEYGFSFYGSNDVFCFGVEPTSQSSN